MEHNESLFSCFSGSNYHSLIDGVMPTFNKENRDVVNADFNRSFGTSHFLHHPAEKVSGATYANGNDMNHVVMNNHMTDPMTFKKPYLASPFGHPGVRQALSPTNQSTEHLVTSTSSFQCNEYASLPEPTPRHLSKPFKRAATDENVQQVSSINAQNVLFHARSSMSSSTTIVSREAPSPVNQDQLIHEQVLALDEDSFLSPASIQPRVPPVTPAAPTNQPINTTPLKPTAEQPEIVTVRRLYRHPFNLKECQYLPLHDDKQADDESTKSNVVFVAAGQGDDQDSIQSESDVSDLTIDGDESLNQSINEYRPIVAYLVRELCGFLSRPGDQNLMRYWEKQPRDALLTAYQHALSMSFNQAIDQTKDAFLSQMKHDSEVHYKELEAARKRIAELEQQNEQKQHINHRHEVRSLQREIVGLKEELNNQREHSNQQLVARVAEARAEILSKWDEEKRQRAARKAERKLRAKEREHAQEQVEDFLNNSGMSLSSTINQSINNTIRHNMTLNNSLAMNISSMAAAVQPLRSITMRVTLESPNLVKCVGELSASLFSRSATHSIVQFQSKTARHSLTNQSINNQLQLNPPLCWTRASTWLSHSAVRLCLYDVTLTDLKNGEQKENQSEVGVVELDTYKLFTSWAVNHAMNGIVDNAEMRAREIVDARAGKSERIISLPVKMHNQSTNQSTTSESPRLVIHATITPPMTVDAYPPPPSMKLFNQSINASLIDNPHVTLNLSGINTSIIHDRSFQAGESFVVDEPASPILSHEMNKARRSVSPLKTTTCEMACQTEPIDQPINQPTAPLMNEMSVQTDDTTPVVHDAGVQCESSSTSISIQTDPSIDTASDKQIIETATMTEPIDESNDPTHVLHQSMQSNHATNPAITNFIALSTTLSVTYPFGPTKLSASTQTQLQRVFSLIRRQWRDSLMWAPREDDTSKQSAKDAKDKSTKSNPIWNPSNKTHSYLHLKQQQAVADARSHLHWNADNQSTSCYSCTRSFNLLCRRHSCRLCGAAACDDCSKKTVDLSEYGLTGHQRVCDLCETTWNIAKGVKHVQPNIVNTPAAPPKEALATLKKSIHPANQPTNQSSVTESKHTSRSSSPAPGLQSKSTTAQPTNQPKLAATSDRQSTNQPTSQPKARPSGIPKPTPRTTLASSAAATLARRTTLLKPKLNQQ